MVKKSKTNVQARTNKGKTYKVCPKCDKNMSIVKLIGFGKRGFYWTCEECKYEISKENSNHLKSIFVKSK